MVGSKLAQGIFENKQLGFVSNTGEKVEMTASELILHKGGGKVGIPLILEVLHDQKEESLEFPGS